MVRRNNHVAAGSLKERQQIERSQLTLETAPTGGVRAKLELPAFRRDTAGASSKSKIGHRRRKFIWQIATYRGPA
jgi:hypothetical protein